MDNIKVKQVDTDYESIAQSLYTAVITNNHTLCNELLDRLCWQLSFTGCEKSIVTVLYETVYRLLVDQPNVCIMWFWTMIRKQLDDMGQDQICTIVKKKLLEDANELASIIYDIFKENKASDKIVNGQNDAKDSAKF